MAAHGNIARKLAPGALVLAGLTLGVLVSPMLSARPAAADPPRNTNEPPFNSTEDRKQIIFQLTDMNQRLGRMEAKLNSGVSVKVTEMPPVVIKEAANK